MRDNTPRTPTSNFTSIDHNAAGTTTVLSLDTETIVTGAYNDHPGSTALLNLQITDGSSTTNITTDQTAGDAIAFDDDIEVGASDLLQVKVETAEGSPQNETAVVLHSQY